MAEAPTIPDLDRASSLLRSEESPSVTGKPGLFHALSSLAEYAVAYFELADYRRHMLKSAAPFSLRLPVVVLQAVDECAKKQGVTRSHVIREACKAYVASTSAEPVENRLAALEAQVKALEEGK